jgi:hypothetical protein
MCEKETQGFNDLFGLKGKKEKLFTTGLFLDFKVNLVK